MLSSLAFDQVLHLQKDGSVKYVGGETYLEKVPSSMRYADLMHRMSEKVNGAVTLKYSPPGEEVDVNNLVTCVDDDHVQASLLMHKGLTQISCFCWKALYLFVAP